MEKIDSTYGGPVILTVDNGVASITFNRPSVLNAVDVTMAEAFLNAVQTIAADESVRVVVLGGAGKGFMAGGDIAAFHADLSTAGNTADALIAPFHEALELMVRLPQPTIASIHGAVAGAGVSVALACDIAIAAENARFALSYSRIGVTLDGGSSWFLPRIVGMRKAMELALLADTIDASEALRIGIVNRVVLNDALTVEVDAIAKRLARGPTYAYGQIKNLLRQSFNTTLQDQLSAEQSTFKTCAGSDDFAEGLNAFFEKRPPDFKGQAPG